MHSKIFQITEERPLKDNILNDCTLEQGDGHYYDYCSEIDEEERKFHIDNLMIIYVVVAVIDTTPVRSVFQRFA